MSGSASVASQNVGHRTPTAPSSKLKTYGFAIAIIIGTAGLAIGIAGLAGYCHVGTLSNWRKLDAIIMMTVGGGGGVILLIIGFIGTIKNRQIGNRQQQHNNVSSTSKDSGAHRVTPLSLPSNTTHSVSSDPASSGVTSTISVPVSPVPGSATRILDSTESVYGSKAWKRWKNVDILDAAAPVPTTVDLSKKDKILLYIPQRVRFSNKEQDFNLNTLKEIAGDSFRFFSSITKKQFGDRPGPGRWVLIDKTVIPESRGKTYEAQQKMVEERGCSLSSALEIVTLNLMVFGLTGERLYGQEPWTYIRCLEKVDGQHPVIVGGFSSSGLTVSCSTFNIANDGVSCVQRKF